VGEVWIDDEARRIEPGDYLLVSPLCVDDLRPRRITAVEVQGRLAMIRYRDLILLPLALGCASPGLASATRCTTDKAQTCTGRMHPKSRPWEGRGRAYE